MSHKNSDVQASINAVMTEIDLAIADAEAFGTPGLREVLQNLFDKAANASHTFYSYSKQKGLDKHER